jgi:glucose/arabinose dehydrogenase
MTKASFGFSLVPWLAAPLLVACNGGGDDPLAPNVTSSGPCIVQNQPSPPAPSPGAPQGLSLQLTQVNTAVSLAFPVFLASPPGDNARIFVAEKGGTVKILDRNTGTLISTFINISPLVSTGSEQGLLGLAFDPQYAANRRFYLNYTDINGNSVIARFLANPVNPNVALATADHVILTVTQPFANHNGGMIAFGQDGFFYVGFGDGGSAGDPSNRAQNTNELLGKLLRIDVSQSGPSPLAAYTVPPSNPCVNQTGVRPEVWSVGLRNPWRFSFDRQSGDLYIADVGQGAREEINLSPLASGGGKGFNYGWDVLEGTICFPPGAQCNPAGLTQPVVEYDHGSGACSITGGYVYRGLAIPALQGTYFYSDFCTSFIRSFRYVNGQVTQHFDWASLNLSAENVTSFGEDNQGELYVMTSQGALYRVVSN